MVSPDPLPSAGRALKNDRPIGVTSSPAASS